MWLTSYLQVSWLDFPNPESRFLGLQFSRLLALMLTVEAPRPETERDLEAVSGDETAHVNA